MDADKGLLRYVSYLSILIIAGLLLAAHLIYLYLGDCQRFPVNTVKVAASYQHISHKELETLLEKYTNFSFFLLPVTKLCAELRSLDWIEDAEVERIWPDIVKVTLREKVPVAIWNDALLTETAEVFSEGQVQGDLVLPILKGSSNQLQHVLHVYKKMSKILSTYELGIAELTLRKNEAWDVTLANGIHLRLGKKDLFVKINRFCKAYPAVFKDRLDRFATVDLRYPRGMAVEWKKKREDNG